MAQVQSLFRPALEPGSPVDDQVWALGCRPLPQKGITRGKDATILAVIDPSVQKPQAVFCVLFDVVSEKDDTRIQLRGRDGSVADEVEVPAGRTRTALFWPGGRVSLVARTERGLVAQAEVDRFAMFGSPLRSGVAQLTHEGDLDRPVDWSKAYLPPDRSDLGGRLRLKAFQGLTEPQPIPIAGGVRVLLQPGCELSRVLFVTGFYEPGAMKAVRALTPRDGVFVDVGAHCGMFTLFASRLVGPRGRVLAFEPSPRELDRLTANIALNRLSNVTASPKAIADAQGEAVLRVAEAGHAGHSTTAPRFTYPAVRMIESLTTPATTIDLALQEAGLKRCDVIRMAIMGTELTALKGAEQTLARHRPAVVLAVSARAFAAADSTVHELVAWLDRQGYVLHDIDPTTGVLLPGPVLGPDVGRTMAALPKTD